MSAQAEQEPEANEPNMGSRELRKGYRDLQNEVKKDKSQLASLENRLLQNVLFKANKLHANIEKPKEHAQDAAVFQVLAEAMDDATRKLDESNNGLSVDDAMDILLKRYVTGPDPARSVREGRAQFARHALDDNFEPFRSTAPQVTFMLGPLDAQPKVRKAPQARQKRQLAPVMRPEELSGDAVGTGDKQETDKVMEGMWNKLHERQGGCPVAELICNHHSFAQTMENMFSLSFLVRDGRVELKHEKATGMRAVTVIGKKKAAAGTQQLQQQTEQSQFVISLTMAHWQRMCEVVKPADCVMDHREHQQQPAEEVLPKRRKQTNTQDPTQTQTQS